MSAMTMMITAWVDGRIGTLMPPHGYLVLCRDTAAFRTVYPGVDYYAAELGYGLSSSGEFIRLFKPERPPGRFGEIRYHVSLAPGAKRNGIYPFAFAT